MKTRIKMTREEKAACIAYLHGDAADEAHEAACFYEYARESRTLRYAARLRNRMENTDWEEVFHRTERMVGIADEVALAGWFVYEPWRDILECRGFPAKGWGELRAGERAAIVRAFSSREVKPLPVLEIEHARRVFKRMSAAAKKRAPALSMQGSFIHAMFAVDGTKTRKQLVEQFKAWLALPDVKAWRAIYKNNQIGKTGAAQDRLKDIAAWRLYSWLRMAGADTFAEKNRLRDRKGKPRAFHDARKPQRPEVVREGKKKSDEELRAEVPLYAEDSGWSDAASRVARYLAKLMPSEFEKPPDNLAGLSRRSKVSKKNA